MIVTAQRLAYRRNPSGTVAVLTACRQGEDAMPTIEYAVDIWDL
jgi:hypothetical protein